MRAASKHHSPFTIHYSLFIIFLLSACTAAPPLATGTAADTGIPVDAAFAAFYDANGGERLFGDAITEGFEAADDGRFTQYFQNMRLELDGDAVVIYPLGKWALEGLSKQISASLPDSGNVRLFPETGIAVQDEFLDFYDEFNGEVLLGAPISAQLDEGDLRVQYFENGRLEWRPELPVEQRIQVSRLGQAHFDAEMSFSYRQKLLAQPVPFAGVARVDVFTSVEAAVLYAGDEQTLYATILTPEGRPVSGISAQVTISFDDNETVLALGQTDAEGRLAVTLPDLNAPPGTQVLLQTAVLSASGDVIGRDSITFKTWW